MDDVESVLLSLKEQALAATKRGDGEFYRGYVADDAVAIVPVGVFDKAGIVAAMSAPGGGFQSTSITDTRVKVLNDDTGIVTYVAEFPGRGSVFVTTVYVRRDGQWQGVLYQQTPLRAQA
ncbi:MAG: hypothetical protein AUI14_23250 [Actinobacteria bacterium 13_2_20CM_2_71_6]|nr:MAG: hypothetical protein AUI14_23250 [Actinobacteria bacterium 13_2_20CM_2_71_6]